MQVVVPFAATSPKTRLEGVLSSEERSTIARAMLADVLGALEETDRECEPTVVSTAPLSLSSALAFDFDFDFDFDSDSDFDSGNPTANVADVTVEVDDRPLTDAVNARLESVGDGSDAVAVVMADLALATPAALERLFEPDADVVVAPGRGGGTNALVVRHPEFRVDYHGASYLDHREIAAGIGATLESVDSHRLATDIDEPSDLVEVLVHRSGGSTRACLREFGFELETSDGRVTVARE
ncbi:2-phospho-L-lactate guanylyltransferase [Halobiforma lacisalsi AJ5]|uniref:2-phospho-L-lactate guanylyltransferase n=1 Tax=Natronobacterium lacisalsi AJ5 TaxID=358396 RepID=M0LJF9_NATLA|nr:2-phospho-L-lactate guanylyltransferase [Halobiforma lacisalsi]APW96579.1 2-phospho-L-lactate guanylyltransferase [Halobiforma lacisalsi AJ5]EMA32140.1 2-phospho-L-lactate guanylyltransferase CofC [Halobiforma lacisalsi AJ5]